MHLLKGLDAHLYSFFNVYLLYLLASRNAQNWAIKVKDEFFMQDTHALPTKKCNNAAAYLLYARNNSTEDILSDGI